MHHHKQVLCHFKPSSPFYLGCEVEQHILATPSKQQQVAVAASTHKKTALEGFVAQRQGSK